MPLVSIGFFLTDEAVAFLCVAPSARLLSLHRDVCSTVSPSALHAFYGPDALLPHCTLAMGVSDHAAVTAASLGHLPIPAVAASAHLIDVRSGASVARLA